MISSVSKCIDAGIRALHIISVQSISYRERYFKVSCKKSYVSAVRI